MLKSIRPVIITLTTTCLLLITHSLLADDCFIASPNLTDDSSYYDLESAKLSDTEKGFIDDLYNQLSGNWEGTAHSNTCYGNEKNPRSDIREASLKVEVTKTRDNRLKLTAAKEFLDRSGRGNETVILFDPKIMSSLKIEGYSVTIVEKYRLNFNKPSHVVTDEGAIKSTGVPNGISLKESIYHLDFSEANWKLKISTYVNGYLAGESIWTLNKKIR